MALEERSFKAIGIILGVGIVLALIFVGLALLNSRPKKEEVTFNNFIDQESGLVFSAPVGWTIGKTKEMTVRLTVRHVDLVDTQKSQCADFSSDTSSQINRLLKKGEAKRALELWKTQYPGLEVFDAYKTVNGMTVLAGIDICNETLVNRQLFFRGQAYMNNLEVKFIRELTLDPESTTLGDLRTLAQNLGQGHAQQWQTDFNSFLQMMSSIRTQ